MMVETKRWAAPRLDPCGCWCYGGQVVALPDTR